MNSSSDPSTTVTLICTLLPRPGKLKRLTQVLTALATNAHAHETGNLKFVVWAQAAEDDNRGAENGAVILYEVWASQADLDAHHEREYLKETHRTLEEEDLLVKPEEIKVVREVEGFWGR